MVELPGYRVLRELGRGGMATVYLAVQESLRREVALKVLAPEMARDDEFTQRFLREARLVASLHHKHIVQVYDVGSHEGRAYLAMEYLPEGAITPLAGQVDARTALDCIAQIASALDYGHARGIVHRDVKLENILRHEDGSFTLSDFGIARVSGAATVRTMQGLTLGTPHYMSPERWHGTKFDGRADLYSLGVVLHALLTGRLPYDGVDDVFALGNLHREAPIPLLPAKFGRLQGLLAKLMAKRPEDRHASGAEVVAHVEALRREGAAGDAAISAEEHERALQRTSRIVREWPFGGDATLPFGESPWRRRRPALLVALLLLAAGAAVAWSMLRPPPDAPVAAVPAPDAASIAVMPFQFISTDLEVAEVAGALADELTTQLARFPGISVAARSSTLAQDKRDAREIARSLGVAHIVEAAIRRDGEHLVVSARLIDASSGFQRWAESYTRPRGELWQLQQDLAARIAASLLSEAELARSRAQLRSPRGEAYADYLRGRQLLSAPSSDQGLASAQAFFDRALAIDPDFARAHAGLCEIEKRRAETARDAAAIARASTTCERASALEPGSLEVALAQAELWRLQGQHALAQDLFGRVAEDRALRFEALLGLARTRADVGDQDGALRHVGEARQLRPGDFRSHALLGTLYLRRSQFAHAVDALASAIELSPNESPRLLNNLASAYFLSGDFPRAAQTYERSRKVEPTQTVLSNLATARFHAGDYPGAVAAYDEALALAGDNFALLGNRADALSLIPGRDADARAGYERAAASAEQYLVASPSSAEAAVSLAWYRACLGQGAKARELLASLTGDALEDPVVLQRLAETHARLGDVERARHFLSKAYGLGLSRRIAATTPWLAAALPADGAPEEIEP